MSKNFFTILFIPSRSTKMKRVVVPHSFMKIGAAMLCGVVLIVSGLVFGFFHYRNLHIDDSLIRTENQTYRREMDQIRSKVAGIQTYLERVRRFDKKLRIITNLEDSERHVALGPIDSSEEGKDPKSEANFASLDPMFRMPDLGGGQAAKKAIEKFNHLQHSLERLESDAAERESSLQTLEDKLKDMGALLRATPAVWPSNGWVTSTFGFRISPFSGTRSMHEGLDIAARPGTTVKSPADGIITFAGMLGNYGKTIVVNHGYGTITRYGHLSDIYVKLGENVKRGDKMGAIGNTGRSTGPHLHYEVVVNGIPRDPKKYILD